MGLLLQSDHLPKWDAFLALNGWVGRVVPTLMALDQADHLLYIFYTYGSCLEIGCLCYFVSHLALNILHCLHPKPRKGRSQSLESQSWAEKRSLRCRPAEGKITPERVLERPYRAVQTRFPLDFSHPTPFRWTLCRSWYVANERAIRAGRSLQ